MRSQEWMAAAACKDQFAWFTTAVEDGRAAQAREFCASCPVLAECTEMAFSPYGEGIPGILAGLTLEQRGQVDCRGCGSNVYKKDTRNGLCWRCYKAAKVAS